MVEIMPVNQLDPMKPSNGAVKSSGTIVGMIIIIIMTFDYTNQLIS